MSFENSYSAFIGNEKIASGDLIEVVTQIKSHQGRAGKATVLVFNNTTSDQVELDLRGSLEASLARLQSPMSLSEEVKRSGPGRPKLGVVSREVTLLPQHWDWLAQQPGGASVTLRKLVEVAKKKNSARDEIRRGQDAAYKFMHAIAGDFPDYEEALRALFAKDQEKFAQALKAWPKDIRKHALKLSERAFPES